MDIEKTMAAMTEQQAKNEADIARHSETLDRLMHGINDLVEAERSHKDRLDGYDRAIGYLVHWSRIQSDRHDALVQAVAESEKRWAKAQEHLAGAMNDLARSQAETEKRLREFIAHVARAVAGGNGRKRRPPRAS